MQKKSKPKLDDLSIDSSLDLNINEDNRSDESSEIQSPINQNGMINKQVYQQRQAQKHDIHKNSQTQNKSGQKNNQGQVHSRQSSHPNEDQAQYGMKNQNIKANIHLKNQGSIGKDYQDNNSNGSNDHLKNPQSNNNQQSNPKPPLQGGIEQRSKRGVNIFQRKRKDQSAPASLSKQLHQQPRPSIVQPLQESIKNKRLDFGEGKEVISQVKQDRRLNLDSNNGSLQSSRLNTQQSEQMKFTYVKDPSNRGSKVTLTNQSLQNSTQQKTAPKVNLFDLMGNQQIISEKSNSNSIRKSRDSDSSSSSQDSSKDQSAIKNQDTNENQRHQILNQSISQSIVGINRMRNSSGQEIKGILKNAQSQSSQQSQSLKGIAFTGINADQLGKRIESKNSNNNNYSNDSSQRSSMKNDESQIKSSKSDQTKKSVKIEEKKSIPQSYMNILNKDEGFQNLREDYPQTETEVLADYYIKNDFNVKKTITDLYHKLRLMPTDKDYSNSSNSQNNKKKPNSVFDSDQDGRKNQQKENVRDYDGSSDDDSDSSSQQQSQNSKYNKPYSTTINNQQVMGNSDQRGSIYSNNFKNNTNSVSVHNPKLQSIGLKGNNGLQINNTLSNTMIKQQQETESDYYQQQQKQHQQRNRFDKNFSQSNLSESKQYNNIKLQNKILNSGHQRHEDYEMDDSSSVNSDDEGSQRQYKQNNNPAMRNTLNQRMMDTQDQNSRNMPKTGSVFDNINNIKNLKVPNDQNNKNRSDQQSKHSYGSFGIQNGNNDRNQQNVDSDSEDNPYGNQYNNDKLQQQHQMRGTDGSVLETLPQKDHSQRKHSSPDNNNHDTSLNQTSNNNNQSQTKLQKMVNQQSNGKGIMKDKGDYNDDEDEEEDNKNVGCCAWGSSGKKKKNKKKQLNSKSQSQQPSEQRMAHEKVGFWRRFL